MSAFRKALGIAILLGAVLLLVDRTESTRISSLSSNAIRSRLRSQADEGHSVTSQTDRESDLTSASTLSEGTAKESSSEASDDDSDDDDGSSESSEDTEESDEDSEDGDDEGSDAEDDDETETASPTTSLAKTAGGGPPLAVYHSAVQAVPTIPPAAEMEHASATLPLPVTGPVPSNLSAGYPDAQMILHAKPHSVVVEETPVNGADSRSFEGDPQAKELYDAVCGKTADAASPKYASEFEQWEKVLHQAPALQSSTGFKPILRQLQVVIRHGDRVNDGQCWPNDEAKFHCRLNDYTLPAMEEEFQPPPTFYLGGGADSGSHAHTAAPLYEPSLQDQYTVVAQPGEVVSDMTPQDTAFLDLSSTSSEPQLNNKAVAQANARLRPRGDPRIVYGQQPQAQTQEQQAQGPTLKPAVISNDDSIIFNAPISRDELEDFASYAYQSQFAHTEASPTLRLFRKRYLPDRNKNDGSNCGAYQLTSRGYVQQIINGLVIRRSYAEHNKFLPPSFQKEYANEILLRSTDIQRTLQSAEALFLGLYPPESDVSYGGGDGSNVDIVDISTMDLANDDLLPSPGVCPRITQVKEQFKASDAFKKHFDDVSVPLWKELGHAVGMTHDVNGTFYSPLMAEKVSSRHLHDCVMVHHCHQFAIPLALNNTPSLAVRLREEIMWELSNLYEFNNNTYAKLALGPFLGELFECFRTIAQPFDEAHEETTPKMVKPSLVETKSTTAASTTSTNGSTAIPAAAPEHPTVAPENPLEFNANDLAWIAGESAQEAVESAQLRASHPPPPMFRLYSGHDTTLMPLLSLLGVWDQKWPPYASMLIFELWQTEADDFGVKIIYNGKAVLPPGCKMYRSLQLCTWPEFSAYVTPLVPSVQDCYEGTSVPAPPSLLPSFDKTGPLSSNSRRKRTEEAQKKKDAEDTKKGLDATLANSLSQSMLGSFGVGI